jgi:hypothetical protein
MLFLKRLKTTVMCLLGLSFVACSAGGDMADTPAGPTGEGGVQVFSSGLITPNPTPTLIPATAIPDFGLAPEINNEVWLNTETALPLSSLKGKVVLVEFWTFG